MKRQISAPRGLWFIAVPGIALVVMPVLAVVWRTNYANFWTSISSESSRVALLAPRLRGYWPIGDSKGAYFSGHFAFYQWFCRQ